MKPPALPFSYAYDISEDGMPGQPFSVTPTHRERNGEEGSRSRWKGPSLFPRDGTVDEKIGRVGGVLFFLPGDSIYSH